MPKTILLISAQPQGSSPLDVESEWNAIHRGISASTYRNDWAFMVVARCTPHDLELALQTHTPTILHFSCHGASTHLCLEDHNGSGYDLYYQDLVRMLQPARRRGLQSVLFNVCHSSHQGQLVANVAGIVVAMKVIVGDTAAARFSEIFYRTFGNGLPFWRSFDDFSQSMLDAPGMQRCFDMISPRIFYATQL